MSKAFNEQVALVTGAASGIGKESSILFARQGVKVVVSDINEEQGNATVEEIKSEGFEACFFRADVGKKEDIAHLVAFTKEKYGQLNIAINNAGIGGPWAKVTDYDDDAFQKVMDINVGGVFYGMKYQLPLMMESGGGSIVNVSSIAGLRGFPNSSVYSASKHAVIGLTKSAAVEFARKNIRVNAVCPVFTRTPLFEQIFQVDPSYEEKLLKNIPMGRYGTTNDIASAILYLCSSEASFVNGQSLALDGGFTAV